MVYYPILQLCRSICDISRFFINLRYPVIAVPIAKHLRIIVQGTKDLQMCFMNHIMSHDSSFPLTAWRTNHTDIGRVVSKKSFNAQCYPAFCQKFSVIIDANKVFTSIVKGLLGYFVKGYSVSLSLFEEKNSFLEPTRSGYFRMMIYPELIVVVYP